MNVPSFINHQSTEHILCRCSVEEAAGGVQDSEKPGCAMPLPLRRNATARSHGRTDAWDVIFCRLMSGS